MNSLFLFLNIVYELGTASLGMEQAVTPMNYPIATLLNSTTVNPLVTLSKY